MKKETHSSMDVDIGQQPRSAGGMANAVGTPRTYDASPKIPLLSFFTGGGFLDLGFERAGFAIKWSNEFDERCADLHDHAYTKWREAIRSGSGPAKISNRKSVKSITAETILEESFAENVPEVFGVIGGPPCTDFSVGGVGNGSAGVNGMLTGVYVNKLLKIKPSFFVFENVPALKHNKKHGEYFRRKLRELGHDYNLHVRILNALDFGVPQDRERLFVVGLRKELDKAGSKFVWPSDPKYTGAKNLTWPKEDEFGRTLEKPRELPAELMVYTAFGDGRGLEHLPNGKEWFNPYSKKFHKVPEGRINTKSFKRLHRFRYSPTAWYGNNEVHLHPTEARRISVRESLRLQAVPDEYVLPEDAPLCAKFKLICNGVPVVLAERVAEAVLAHVRKFQIIPNAD